MKKVVVLKIIYLYIAFLVIMFSPLCVNAEALTYNEASNMVQEVMKQ